MKSGNHVTIQYQILILMVFMGIRYLYDYGKNKENGNNFTQVNIQNKMDLLKKIKRYCLLDTFLMICFLKIIEKLFILIQYKYTISKHNTRASV